MYYNLISVEMMYDFVSVGNLLGAKASKPERLAKSPTATRSNEGPI
jgi:hypothetical protein